MLDAAGSGARPSPSPTRTTRFVDGLEVLCDGSELHLVSFHPADVELPGRLAGADDRSFAAMTAKYADVLAGAPKGMP
jgi:hypothetical protein